jgi:hypothetical protein
MRDVFNQQASGAYQEAYEDVIDRNGDEKYDNEYEDILETKIALADDELECEHPLSLLSFCLSF